jgi:quercetin dioxygenase-like cupin family protein
MSSPSDRLRPHPSERFAGPEHLLDFGASLAALRGEAYPARDGRRQIVVFHSATLRLALFAFDSGACLPRHRAPGVVVIQTLRGTLHVRTPGAEYELGAGQALVLAPEVPHEVEAAEEADMLLSVAMGGARRAEADEAES